MLTEIILTGQQLVEANWYLEDDQINETFGFRVDHQAKRVENYIKGKEDYGSQFEVDYGQFLIDFPNEVASAKEDLGFTWDS